MEVAPVVMEGSTLQESNPKPELGLLFVLLVGLSVALSPYLPAAFIESWRQLVMGTATSMGTAAGLLVTARADILSVSGFEMRVANECTAFNYVLILSTAILLYTRHTIRYRLVGILVAVPVIVLANAFRLLVTGLCGTVSWSLFNIVHEYIWVALFALLIFAMWKVWADRSLQLSKKRLQHIAVTVACASSVFLVLVAISPAYGALLAFVASNVLKIFLVDPHVAIAWIGDKMQSSYCGLTYQVLFPLEYYNVAVFAGLALPLQRKGDWKTFLLTLLGLVCAILLNAIFIANAMQILIRHGQDAANVFLLMEKGLLLAVPFALWWIVSAGKGRREDAPQKGSFLR